MLVGIIIVAVLLVALVAMLVLKGRGVEGPAIAVKPERNTADLQPMTGLESALDQAMDRSGRNMRDKLESDTAIDELRIPDDTGPILRRALDHVEHRAHPQPGETPTAS